MARTTNRCSAASAYPAAKFRDEFETTLSTFIPHSYYYDQCGYSWGWTCSSSCALTLTTPCQQGANAGTCTGYAVCEDSSGNTGPAAYCSGAAPSNGLQTLTCAASSHQSCTAYGSAYGNSVTCWASQSDCGASSSNNCGNSIFQTPCTSGATNGASPCSSLSSTPYYCPLSVPLAPSPPPPATLVTSMSNSPSFVLNGIPSALGSTVVSSCTGAFYLVTGGAVLSPGTTCSGNSGGTGPNAQQNVYATMTGSCFVHQGPNYSIILVQGAQDMLLCDNNGAMYAPNTGASTFPASMPAVSSWYYYSGSAWTPVAGTSFNVAINAPSPISSSPPPPPPAVSPSPQYVSGPCTSDAACSAACRAYNLCSGGNSCPGAWSSSSSGNTYSCLCGATGISSTTISPTCQNLAGSPPPPPPPVSSPPPPPPRRSPPPSAPAPSYSPVYSASPTHTPSSASVVRAARICSISTVTAVILGI